MTGNVWEWVQDGYDKGAYGESGMDNPKFEGSGNRRVIRGGGWNNSARKLRCSKRGNKEPVGRSGTVGFRLVRVR